MNTRTPASTGQELPTARPVPPAQAQRTRPAQYRAGTAQVLMKTVRVPRECWSCLRRRIRGPASRELTRLAFLEAAAARVLFQGYPAEVPEASDHRLISVSLDPRTCTPGTGAA